MQHALLLVLILALQVQQPAEVAIKFNRAVELQSQGALKEAAVEYRALLAVAPDYAEAHANLGAVLARLGQYEEAIASYQRALEINPNLTPVWLNLGIAHYRAGQWEKAVGALQQFLSFSPDSLQARQLLGLALVEMGRDEEAIGQLEPIASAQEADPAALYGLGLAYLRLGKPQLQKIADRLAAMPTGLAIYHLLMGQKLMSEGRYKQAIEELESAAKLNAELPRLDYLLGLSYFLMGERKLARLAFEKELRRRVRDFWTRYYLALINEAERDLDTAKQHLDAALKLEPSSPQANALLGKILVKQGKAAEAVVPLETAVAGDPNDSEVHYFLGRAYQQLGRRQDAKREFAESQRLKGQQLEKEKKRTP
jgi:tetratricopeptide (TPR) repeat protein